jgi:hypothetical protein
MDPAHALLRRAVFCLVRVLVCHGSFHWSAGGLSWSFATENEMRTTGFAILVLLLGIGCSRRSTPDPEEVRMEADDTESSIAAQLLNVNETDVDELSEALLADGVASIPSLSRELASYDHPNRRRLCKVLSRILNANGGFSAIPKDDTTTLPVFLVETMRLVWPVKPMSNPHHILSRGTLCERELLWAIRDTEREIKSKKASGDTQGAAAGDMVLNKLRETLKQLKGGGEQPPERDK